MDFNRNNDASKTVNEQQLLEKHEDIDTLVSSTSLNCDEERNFKTIAPQLIATIISACFYFVVGISLAYSAILIPQLMDEQANHDENAMEISTEESSWIASCFPLVIPFGAVICGFLMDAIGRLNVIKLAAVPSLCGWALIAISANYPVLLTGRILTGIASVWAASPAIVYITEISRVDLRGPFTMIPQIFACLGMIIVFLKGWFLNWRLVAWMCFAYSIIPVVLMYFIPESPAWLVSKGKIKKAKKSLQWFYKYQPQDPRKSETFAEIKLLVLQKEHAIKHKEMQKSTFSEKLRMFSLPTFYKPLLILSGVFLFQQFGGVFVVLFYGVTFFKEMGTDINPYLASVILGLIRLVMSILNAGMMKKYNRRSLCFVSGLGMAVSFGISGMFTKWISEGTSNQYWIPMCMFMSYILFMMGGVSTVPFIIIAEMFPLAVRGVGYSLVFSIAHLIMFAALQSYYTLNDLFGGSYGIQYFYALVSLAGVVFNFVFLPETFNKTLSEIEEYFWNHTVYLSVPPKRAGDLKEKVEIKTKH